MWERSGRTPQGWEDLREVGLTHARRSYVCPGVPGVDGTRLPGPDADLKIDPPSVQVDVGVQVSELAIRPRSGPER